MTKDLPVDDITSVAAFKNGLSRLTRAAARNEIDPRGSWEIRSDGTMPDWEAMIVELEKSD